MTYTTLAFELGAGAVALAGLSWNWGDWSGTTLQAPRRWCQLTVVLILAVDVLLWLGEESLNTRREWRYLADAGLICPGLSLLGAKRPQDRAWQWIVLAFWALLAVPWAQRIAFGQGNFQLPITWHVLLGALLLLQVANYALTRQAPAVVLFTLSHAVLLGSVWRMSPAWLSQSGLELNSWSRAVAMTGVALSVLWAQRTQQSHRHALPSPDRAWREYRDAFGMAWGVRVLERVNEPSQLNGWSWELAWFEGFQARPAASQETAVGSTDSELPIVREQQRQALRAALRRFVTPEWLEKRMGV